MFDFEINISFVRHLISYLKPCLTPGLHSGGSRLLQATVAVSPVGEGVVHLFVKEEICLIIILHHLLGKPNLSFNNSGLRVFNQGLS